MVALIPIPTPALPLKGREVKEVLWARVQHF